MLDLREHRRFRAISRRGTFGIRRSYLADRKDGNFYCPLLDLEQDQFDNNGELIRGLHVGSFGSTSAMIDSFFRAAMAIGDGIDVDGVRISDQQLRTLLSEADDEST